jgi:hypothetical protein
VTGIELSFECFAATYARFIRITCADELIEYRLQFLFPFSKCHQLGFPALHFGLVSFFTDLLCVFNDAIRIQASGLQGAEAWFEFLFTNLAFPHVHLI